MSEVKIVSETKPGVKTSEFWLSLLTILSTVGGSIAGALPGPWGVIAGAIAAGAYAASRAVAKKPPAVVEVKP